MAILGREILEGRATETKEIEVPEWGGSILIRKLTGAEVPKLIAMATSAFDQDTKQLKDPERMTRMLAMGLFLSWTNEQGGQVLNDREKDVERLTREPFELLSRLGDEINAWNGIGANAVAGAKKNSEPTPNSDFGIN